MELVEEEGSRITFIGAITTNQSVGIKVRLEFRENKASKSPLQVSGFYPG